MKIKIDENLPSILVHELQELGHDVDDVHSEGLTGRIDGEIWEAARRENRFLITQDVEFSDIRLHRPGTHPGVLLVRLDKPSLAALLRLLRRLFATEDIDSWSRCVVVATERKLRIRWPA